MSGHWVEDNLDSFKRDVLRDFCLGAASLEEQFARFAAGGTLSFAVMHALTGDKMFKGPLWRLKDTAHHLFGLNDGRASTALSPHMLPHTTPHMDGRADNCSIAALLDWTIGYIYHECVKITEDSYQLQYYEPKLPRPGSAATPEERISLDNLAPIIDQSYASLDREVKRVAYLMDETRRLFCLYLAGENANRPLARFLLEREDLVSGTFHAYHNELLEGIYGPEQEKMPLLAAHSFLETGHTEKAMAAARRACSINPYSLEAQEFCHTLQLDMSWNRFNHSKSTRRNSSA